MRAHTARPVRRFTVRTLSLLALAAAVSVWLASSSTRADVVRAELPRSAPEVQGVSSAALLDFVEAADREIDAMHSLMVVRHWHVIAEGCWAPYAPDVRHTLYSLTKSFTSTAIGLAQSEGLLSINDPVVKFFPDKAPAAPSDHLKALRIRDLLSMSTGHIREPALRTVAMGGSPENASPEWTRTFLASPIDYKPGTHFLYNTPASYMLSAIVQKVTGTKTLDYLKPRLFDPLGIDDIDWETSPEGVSIGGYGLHLRTESIARFGQLYLKKGAWQGRQLLPATWVETATSRQVSNGSSPDSDWDQGYGFQFWRSRHGAYRGDGAYGQYCLVLPDQDAVVVITSGVKNMQAVLDLVFAKLLPAFKPAALPADAAGESALRKKLSALSLHTPQGQPTPAPGIKLGRRYVFPQNAEKIEAVTLELASDGTPTFVVRTAGVDQRFAAPYGKWATTRLPEKLPTLEQSAAASGAWTNGDTFAMTLAYYETPFKVNMRLTFGGDIVVLEREMHVGFGDTKRPTLVGRAQ